MGDEGFDREAELGEVGERGVDRADFVELDDAEARGRSGPRPLTRASPLALGTVAADGVCAGMPTSTLSLPPASFSCLATKSSSSPRVVNHSSRPSNVDVVDGEAAAGVLPFGVDLEADAAAFEGDDRLFERGECADEAGHLLAFDEAAVVRVEDGVGQALVEELACAFPLRFARSRCSTLFLTRKSGGWAT